MKFRRPYSCSPVGPIATIELSSTSSERPSMWSRTVSGIAGSSSSLRSHRIERTGPRAATDATFGEHPCEKLLCHEVHRLGWRDERLDPAVEHEPDQRKCLEQLHLAGRQKQAVARRPGPPARPADALKQRSDGGRRADLDHPVEVPDVDPELERRGCDDHAVPRLAERPLGLEAVVTAQRRVRHEHGGSLGP